MKLFQIEYILAVCEHGSISKAADAIMVSRPAVSRAVKEVEEEYGMSLFRRTTSGVELTEAGELLYERCRKLQQLMLELDKDMRVLRAEMEGKKARMVTVGLSYTARCCIMPFLKAFKERYPDVTLTLTDVYYSYLDTRILNDKYDLEITLSEGGEEENIGYLDIGVSFFAFCCGRNHPLAKQKQVTVSQIRDEAFVSLTGLDAKNNQLLRLFAKFDWQPNIAYLTAQVSSLRSMIKEGICCSVQPIQSMEHDPEIVTIPIEGVEPLKLRMIWNKEQRQNSACRDFIDFADSFFREKPIGT